MPGVETYTIEQRIEAGRRFHQIGSHQRAVEQYHAALALNPDCADAHAALASVLTDMGRLHEAHQAAEAALAIAPTNAFFLFVKGLVFQANEEWAQAQQMFEQAIEINPNSARYFAYLSFALNSQKRHIEAEKAAQQAIALNPQYSFAHRCLGYILVKQGRTEEAHTAFAEALRLNPDNYAEHAGMAFFYVQMNDQKRALPHVCEALRLDPTTDAVKLVPVKPKASFLTEDIGDMASRVWKNLRPVPRIAVLCFLGLVMITLCGFAGIVARETQGTGVSMFPFTIAAYVVMRACARKK